MYETQFEEYIKQCRWFGGKGRTIKELNLKDTITLAKHHKNYDLHIIEIIYSAGPAELYILPVAFRKDKPADGLIAKAVVNNKEGFLCEAVYDNDFRLLLLELISKNETIKTKTGEFSALRGRNFNLLLKNEKLPADSSMSQFQQTNSSFFYNEVFFLKLYRRLQHGIHPESQMTKYITENTDFNRIPAFAGSIEWKPNHGDIKTIALLQQYIKNKGNAWDYFNENIENFSRQASKQSPYTQTEELLDPAFIQNLDLLAQRTAQLHNALAGVSNDNEISPEPVSVRYNEYLYESVKTLACKVFDELNFENAGNLIKNDIAKLISIKEKVFERIENIKKIKLSGNLIRTHGDYHLGQVLFTGNDFYIIDFEGEPTRSLTHRKQKHLALRDVAGMIRSFHYLSYAPLLKNTANIETESGPYWTLAWYQYVSEKFLNDYLRNLQQPDLLPNSPEQINYMLEFYMLEKAIYELDYELHNRPSWLIVAAKGILQIISKKTGITLLGKNI
jgi:maltose alpha-D-glucosyltransferase/alpha-amylase